MTPCVTCELRQRPCGGRGRCSCTVSGRQIEDHRDANYCPHPDGPRFGDGRYPLDWESRGAGDTLAKVIHVVTLGLVKPCGKCDERREKMNEAVPYKATEGQ